MKHAKLSEIIFGLSETDFKKLGDFVKSPYHNKNRYLVDLYEYFLKTRNKRLPVIIDDNAVFKAVFPGEKYSLKKIDSHFSKFKTAIEEFFICEELRAEMLHSEVMTLNRLQKHKYEKNFLAKAKKLDLLFKNSDSRTEEYYYSRIKFESAFLTHNYAAKIYSNGKSFQNLADYVDEYFICMKLKSLILMRRHQSEVRMEINYDLKFETEIITRIEKDAVFFKKDHPYIYSLYLVYRTLVEPGNGELYTLLKKYVNNSLRLFSGDSLREILIEMTNYCDDRIPENSKKYTGELFKIYDTLDKKSLLLQGGFIGHLDFINAFIVASELNKSKWINMFYKKYSNRLMPELKSDTLNLTMAEICYQKKEYDSALELLNKINSRMFYFFLRIKMLRAKIYYDLNEFSAMVYVIDSIRHYIQRNKKIPGPVTLMINKFLSYTGRLIKIKEQSLYEDAEKLKTELEYENNIASKRWLIAKIEELAG